jgi:hypothetical protein
MSQPTIIQSQYLAASEMLKHTIEKCPAELWLGAHYKNRTWHIAYHALFYAHLYLSETEKTFKPWCKHRPDSNDLRKIGEPYSQDEVLEYLAICQQEVKRLLPILDLDSSESGFYWLPFSKLELQFYNIRHLQQHTGELMERLGVARGIDVDWVGTIAP